MPVDHAFVVPHPPIILPEVGGGEEKKISDTSAAFGKIAGIVSELKPRTIIVTSPHADAYSDYIAVADGGVMEGDMGRFGAYGVGMSRRLDDEFIETLTEISNSEGLPAGTLGSHRENIMDHGTLIPLYFINKKYTDYRLVVTGISGLSAEYHYRFGMAIEKTAEKLGRNAVFIASGDLSHRLKADGPYGFRPEGPEFDERITKAIGSADFESILHMEKGFCENAAECGLRSFQVMAGIFDRRSVTAELLSYEGPFGVGYAVAALTAGSKDADRHFV